RSCYHPVHGRCGGPPQWRPVLWRGCQTDRARPAGDRRVVAWSKINSPTRCMNFSREQCSTHDCYLRGTASTRNGCIIVVLRRSSMARRYSRGASRDVERSMRKRKRGTLKSGRSGRKVKSRKQAIAIGLSEARRKGKKVPRKRRQ